MNFIIPSLATLLLLNTCSAMIFGRILGLPKRLQQMYEQEEALRNQKLKEVETSSNHINAPRSTSTTSTSTTSASTTTTTTTTTSGTPVINTTTNSSDIDDWRRMKDDDNFDTIFDGTNKTAAEMKQAIKELIKRKSILHEGFAFEKAHHMHVGIDHGSIDKKMKEYEELQKKKQEEAKKIHEKLKRCGKGMPDDLSDQVAKYIDKFVKNCTKQKEPNYASLLKKSLPDQCTDLVEDFKCKTKPRKDINPKHRISGGKDRFPPDFIHQDCYGCTKCMFGQGRCENTTMNINIYVDEGNDGRRHLQYWKPKTYTINTGCKCVIDDQKKMENFAYLVKRVICDKRPEFCGGYKDVPTEKILSLFT